ncbi:hypothetical protein ILYODFUR_037557, partial [Ilyodon furcidens]
DEILGATINFDQLSKEEVIKVLKVMEPFDDKVQVLTRSGLSKSMDNLDQCARNPEAMLKDSYSKLYNAKIKRFVKDDLSAANKSTVATSSKVNLKHDMGLPRLGVDFGLLKSKSPMAETNEGSKSETRHLIDGSNLNLPPLGVSLNGLTAGDTQVPRLKLDARNPQSHLSRTLPDDLNAMNAAAKCLANTDRTSENLKMPNPERVLDTGLATKDSDVTLLDPFINNPNTEVMTPDEISAVPIGKLSLKHSKRLKTPDLNLDDPFSFVGSSKLRLSETLPQMELGNIDVDAPPGSVTLPTIGLSGESQVADKTLDFSLKNTKIKSGMSASDANLSKADLKGTNLATDTPLDDIKGPSGNYKAPKFTMPKFDLPDIQLPGFNRHMELPDADLHVPKVNIPEVKQFNSAVNGPDIDVSPPKFKGGINFMGDFKAPDVGYNTPSLDMNTPDIDISSPKSKQKMPKFKMPTFNLPGFRGPQIDASLDKSDMAINGPSSHKLKTDLDEDVSGPSGKFKKPNLNLPDLSLSGPKIDSPNLDLGAPDLDVSGPNLRGGINMPDINMPKADFKTPKLDLSGPKANLDMPSGKLKMPEIQGPDWDVNGPSGKLKMPKMNLSGTLPKGPNLDLNADLKSPDLNLKAPKIKGGMNAPDLDMPDMNLKGPKLDVNTPDVNIGSPKGKFKMPKMKMPKFGLPSMKGPELD